MGCTGKHGWPVCLYGTVWAQFRKHWPGRVSTPFMMSGIIASSRPPYGLGASVGYNCHSSVDQATQPASVPASSALHGNAARSFHFTVRIGIQRWTRSVTDCELVQLCDQGLNAVHVKDGDGGGGNSGVHCWNGSASPSLCPSKFKSPQQWTGSLVEIHACETLLQDC
jgi:hypothetical protein